VKAQNMNVIKIRHILKNRK